MKSVRAFPLANFPVSATGNELGSSRTTSVTRRPLMAVTLSAIEEQYAERNE